MTIRLEHRVPALITGPSAFFANWAITKKAREGEESQAQYQHDQSRYDRQSNAIGAAIKQPIDMVNKLALAKIGANQQLENRATIAGVQSQNAMDRQAYQGTGYSRKDLQGMGRQIFESSPQYEGPMQMSFNDAASRYGTTPEGFAESLGRQAVQAQQFQAAQVQQEQVWAGERMQAAQDKIWDSTQYSPKQVKEMVANRQERAAVIANPSIAEPDKQAIVVELDRAYRAPPAGAPRQQPQPFSTPTAIPSTNKVGFIDPGGKFHTFDAKGEYPPGQGIGQQWHDSSGVYYRDTKGTIKERESFSPDYKTISGDATQIMQEAANKTEDGIPMMPNGNGGMREMTHTDAMNIANERHDAYVSSRIASLERDAAKKQAEAMRMQMQQQKQQYMQAKQFVEQASQAGPIDPQSDKGKQVQQATQFIQQFEQQLPQMEAQLQQIAQAGEQRQKPPMREAVRPEQPEATQKDVMAARDELSRMMRKAKHISDLSPEDQVKYKRLLQIVMSQAQPEGM